VCAQEQRRLLVVECSQHLVPLCSVEGHKGAHLSDFSLPRIHKVRHDSKITPVKQEQNGDSYGG
jgi:hypothetical protein